MKSLIAIVALFGLSACTTNPGYNMGSGAAYGCAGGALATIWTGPGALAGCGIGAAIGAAGGLASTPPPPPPPPYYAYPQQPVAPYQPNYYGY